MRGSWPGGNTGSHGRSGATPGDARRINRRVLCDAIHRDGPLSRAELAKASGLTPASVSAVVRDLINDDLVEELAPRTTGGVGKPAIPLGLRADGRLVAVVDLSRREAFVAALVDLQGKVVERIGEPRSARVGDDALDATRDLLARLVAASTRPLLGVGIASPGLVVDSRLVVESAHLAWHLVDLHERLGDLTDAAVTVANDANAGALGEVAFGDDSIDDMLYVRIDDGVGAGVVLDGRLHVGAAGGGGEVGHIVVQPDGPMCVCGNRGCLETLVSEPLSDPDSTVAAIEAAGVALGAGLASVVSTLDVDHLVLGGVAHALDERFVAAVASEVTARTLPALAERLVVRPTSLHVDDVLLGAAAIVLDAELGIR